VDAFAGAEFQFGTGVARAAEDETRAAAALAALDGVGTNAPLAPPVISAFVEEDPAHLGRIYAALEDTAGGERLRAVREMDSLQPGEASLVEAPFASVAAEVARFAARAHTFALLAPPAARALPWEALRPLAAIPSSTLLIRIPAADFEKQSRHTSPLADLPGFARRIVEGCSAFLGDAKHAWLPAWRTTASAIGPQAAMDGILERFRALLDGVAGGRLVKPLELESADGARTYLFLVTPDSAVALAANAAVREAGMMDRAASSAPIPAAPVPAPAPASEEAPPPARPVRRAPKAAAPQQAAPQQAAPQQQPVAEAPAVPIEPIRSAPASGPPADEWLDLFPEQLPAPEPAPPARPDAAALAVALEGRFGGGTVPWREILRAFAATDVTPAELKQALAVLRRGGRAVYKALKSDDDAIAFPTEPGVREKPKRRKKMEGDAGLFGEAGDPPPPGVGDGGSPDGSGDQNGS
jgi:hypothetical protein